MRQRSLIWWKTREAFSSDPGHPRVLGTTRRVSTTHFVRIYSWSFAKLRALTFFAATYGYAKQYSGVNLATYVKHITSAHLTAQGLKNVGSAVMQLAGVEQLEAHKRAVSIRLQHMEKSALQL